MAKFLVRVAVMLTGIIVVGYIADAFGFPQILAGMTGAWSDATALPERVLRGFLSPYSEIGEAWTGLNAVEKIAYSLLGIGLVGLLATKVVVYQKLNMAQLSQNAITGGTREHHGGLSLKWPWSTLQQPVIDMRASVIVTSGGVLCSMTWDEFMQKGLSSKIEPRVYETLDSVLYGSWATSIRPREGGLATLVLQTLPKAATEVMATIDTKISDYLAVHHTGGEEGVLQRKKEISTLVAEVFVNENTESPLEKAHGIWVSNPKLFDLNLGERSQQARERRFEAIQFEDAVKSMMAKGEEGQRPNWVEASNAVLVATGVSKREEKKIEIVGLEGAVRNLAEAFIKKGGS